MCIKKIFIYISCIIILTSCGGGGGGNNIIDDKPAQLIINSSSFPSGIYSYDPAELIISSNYPSCAFNVTSSYIYWMTSSDNVFSFNAPITFLENESFPINISSISSESCPTGQKNIEITVNRLNTKYTAVPSNISDLSTDFYNIVDIGFGGISLSETYSATICYPTPEDCITYVDQVFGQDAHNMQTGDFNGDGFEDLAVVWAIFPHTIEEDQKIPAPIHIYLNDGKGHLYEDMSIFANEEYPTHPFAYRTVIRDFNSDGIDDIFAGSMGKSVRYEDYSQNYIKPYPHLLLLSNSDGSFDDKSSNIQEQNIEAGENCGFAHDASAGDFDADGDFDIYACNVLLVNNGFGEFSTHNFINFDWNKSERSPMSSLVEDLNNDNYADLLFWNFDNRSLDMQPEEGTILLSDGSSEISNWSRLDLPKGPFEVNHNKYNHAASGDINGDGYKDVVVAITRDDPYYEGAYIQILINDQTGSLIDETTSRFVDQIRLEKHHGEGNIYLKDLDNDGDLDIFHSTRDFQNNSSGAHIAINDGQGNFISNESILPARPLSDTGWSTSSGLMKGVPINLDNKGCLDLISTSDSWSNENTVNNYLFSIINLNCSF